MLHGALDGSVRQPGTTLGAYWNVDCSMSSCIPPHFLDSRVLSSSFEPLHGSIDVRATKMPHPEMIGSAIGLKVMEDVLYIVGMDRSVPGINEETTGYLKDLGAATASNGALGLYHMEGVTPEAKEKGRYLLREGYQTYVIDDAELCRIYKTYPNLWKDKHGTPQRVFLGCPTYPTDK
jgi:predicted aconitase